MPDETYKTQDRVGKYGNFKIDFNTEQLQTQTLESAEMRRLWELPLAEVLAEVLTPEEFAALERDLKVEKLVLPDAFALEPDGSPIQLEIFRRIEPLQSPLYNLVCIEWNYCAKRDKVSLALGLALNLLAFLLSHGLSTTVPLSALIVTGIRTGYFDKLCNCGASKAGEA